MKNLKHLREARNLSQSALAAMSGIAATVISNFECGVRKPSYKNLFKLRKALGCTWDELLGK